MPIENEDEMEMEEGRKAARCLHAGRAEADGTETRREGSEGNEERKEGWPKPSRRMSIDSRDPKAILSTPKYTLASQAADLERGKSPDRGVTKAAERSPPE